MIRPGAIARLADEVRMRARGEMRCGVGEIKEERLLGLGLAHHEVDRLGRQVAVNESTISRL